jgi:hypothetical protein
MQNMAPDVSIEQVWVDKIIELVYSQGNFIVPIRWILRQLGPETPLSEQALAHFFKSDDRFQLFSGLDLASEDGPITQFSVSELEAMGFYQGPKVMLKDRVPSSEEIVQFLIKKAEQTYSSLLRAWETRPERDDRVEDQLLEALAKAQRLKRELREVLET